MTQIIEQSAFYIVEPAQGYRTDVRGPFKTRALALQGATQGEPVLTGRELTLFYTNPIVK